ncbi:MAG: polysaccharide biosynthesis tyrosine autokinase [Synechococcales cyanobacterium M58_A2018_015]|nr:polysaccharide biosynthesis tyrosine autokinase [Synechococcales cyanobacterium M58_A2018_015]
MKAGQYIQSPSQTEIVPLQPVPESGLNVGQLFAALRRKLLLVLGVTAAVTGAAGLKALTDTPIYSARLEILVQSMTAETEIISSVPGTLTSEQGPPATKTPTVNEDLLRILSSPKILVPVFEKLKQEYPAVCQAFGGNSTPPESTAELSVPAASSANLDETSTANLGETANDPCYKSVVRRVSVGVVGKDSNIIQATYQGVDPNEVQTFLELLSQAYLNYSLASRQTDINRATQFVNKKLPDLEQRVATLQDRLEQLRLRHNLIDPESRGQQLSNQVGAFSQQQLEAQVELEQIRALYSDLQSQLASQPSETAASAALSENPRYQALLNRLLELDAKIAATSTVFLDTTPDMQVLREERQNLLSILSREGTQAQREVLSKIQALQVREQALRETLSSLNSGVRELSGVSRQYADIQRELEIATQTLNQFLAKQQALQIEAAQREVPWEVLTPATEPLPTVSSMSQNLILGAILGLLLGVGVALLFDRLTEVIYTAEELKRLVRMPLLGSIPYNEALVESGFRLSLFGAPRPTPAEIVETRRTSSLDRADSFFEAFRSLHANIRLLNSDTPIRSFVISSTAPGEGKTTVAAYLAQAAAAMDQRVLVIDTDLRCPRLHEYLNLTNDKGLVDVLSGDAEVSQVLQRSPLEPNLYVLTAGPTPPDPTRLLSSQRMHHLMEQAHKTFDLIIYDTPPLLGFADSYLVTAHTDGVMLVVELGKLKRSLLEQTLEQLKISSTQALGVILQKSTQA